MNAQTYLQPHYYGNGLFGNVYLSPGKQQDVNIAGTPLPVNRSCRYFQAIFYETWLKKWKLAHGMSISIANWRCVFYENQKNFECSFRVIGPHCDMIPHDCTMQGRQIWQTDRQQAGYNGIKLVMDLFPLLRFEDTSFFFLFLTSLELTPTLQWIKLALEFVPAICAVFVEMFLLKL